MAESNTEFVKNLRLAVASGHFGTLVSKTFLDTCNRIEQQQKAIKTLLALMEATHKEGYGEGYEDGVATDGCVDNSIIDENDWAARWNLSAAKKVVAEAEELIKP